MANVTRPSGTAPKILDTAERLLQVRGYNGFSYADIAATLRITKASLHYHFPTKADLGQQLMERYIESFRQALTAIGDETAEAPQKLARYVAIYADVLANNRMCLCGMLAAEHATLPKPIRAEVLRFFDLNEAWLADVLEDGRQRKSFNFPGTAMEAARVLVAGLEGAMLLARSYGDAQRFDRAARRLLAELGASVLARPTRARTTRAQAETAEP
jgi:TetR/AcrR family transcriptional repressor of nem operon